VLIAPALFTLAVGFEGTAFAVVGGGFGIVFVAAGGGVDFSIGFAAVVSTFTDFVAVVGFAFVVFVALGAALVAFVPEAVVFAVAKLAALEALAGAFLVAAFFLGGSEDIVEE